MLKNFLAYSLLFISVTVSANVRLPAIIGPHMVLQQNAAVKIWGWSDPGEKITLKTDWDTTTYTTVGSSGANWSIQIKTPAAGGPYRIIINGYNQIVLQDVLIGEVWVCGGQSNMEMNFNWGLQSNYGKEADAATDNSIRFFYVPKTTADFPQDDVKAEWIVCNPDAMKQFSIVGYFFGEILRQHLNVPIGLINSNWGGTPAETWTPSELVNNNPVLKAAAVKLTASKSWPIIPGAAYNGMIYPITKFTIAGTIWYQGETNVGTADTYHELFADMIMAWRKAWQKDFPFYYVQIAPFSGYGDNSSSAFLREAQTKTLTVPNTGMVVTTDLVNDINNIHPKMKKEVAIRLANYALAETYGEKNIAYKSPEYKSMKIENGKIRVYFDNAEDGLMSKGDTLKEFFIAGKDQNFLPAEAKIDGNSIIAWNERIKKPVAVRFAFRNATQPNLFNKEGLPVDPFRTDDWPVQIILGKK